MTQTATAAEITVHYFAGTDWPYTVKVWIDGTAKAFYDFDTEAEALKFAELTRLLARSCNALTAATTIYAQADYVEAV